MLTNGDCTIFEKESGIRHCIQNVYWHDCRGMTVHKGGIQISDSITVYLYTDAYLPKAGDLLVQGNADFSFDASSEKAFSESMRKFRTAFPAYATVKTVSDCRLGGLPHIEITAR